MSDNQNIQLKESHGRTEITTTTTTPISTTASNELTNTDDENYPKVIRAKDIKPAFITIR